MKFSLSCMGSRERYSMPVVLHRLGLLDQFYTDIYIPKVMRVFSGCFGKHPGIQALFNRYHEELPFRKTTQYPTLGIQFRKKIRKANSLLQRQQLLCEFGEQYAQNVKEDIAPGQNLIGFSGQALESLRRCKEGGGYAVLDQVDPGLFEWELIARETSKYPDWSTNKKSSQWDQNFEKRVFDELSISDHIIVNSEYSKRSLEYWGVEKNVTVIPIPATVTRIQNLNEREHKELRVLFLGAISIRKGVHYLFPALDRLVSKGKNIKFKIAGELQIPKQKLSEYPNIEYLGPVSGATVIKLLDWTDLLVFPTLSDGFGMVQLEAMSRGVPVIASKNCAEIVDDGVTGKLLDAVTEEDIESCILHYYNSPETLQTHSEHAFTQSKNRDLSSYENDIKSFVHGISEFEVNS